MRKRFQKGSILKRNGSWFIRYKDSVLENGVVRRKLMFAKLDVPDDSEHRTKASVRAIATDFLLPINKGTQDARSYMTVIEYIEQVYIPQHVEKLRPASQRQYRGVWRLYIKPWLDPSITLRDFEAMNGETILEKISEHTRACRSSLKHCKAFLSGAFSRAIRLGILKGAPNPMREVQAPKKPPTKPTHAYTLNEIDRILNVLPEPAHTVVFVAAYTGLRKSELWGLEWRDFDRKTLKIQRGIWNGITSEPKTEASKASIPVFAQVADALEDHRERQGRLAVGPIFQNGMGKPQNLDNLARRFIVPALNRCRTCRKPIAAHPTEGHMPERDESLPQWHGWHAFRRGLATNLHAMGVNDVTIQSILRHDDVNTTRKIYIKSVPESATEAMNQLGEKVNLHTRITKTAPSDQFEKRT